MARIKIENIPVEQELSDSDLDKVSGGILIGSTMLLSPTYLAPSLYGSYSITALPLGGITVAGVRG
jgi:hypothetical protein